MEISELTDAILSDDYEEGEILDEDTLYDNVSSLEEFSGSDYELKSHGENNSFVVKKTSDGRKEKHHRRKEHKCKEDSICRKERSGKHCYARIRKRKTSAEVTEKAKNLNQTTVHDHDNHNQKKKSINTTSSSHSVLPRHNSHRLSGQKDLHEKENRCGHNKHTRYHDSHKSGPHRIDKKKFCEKLKKHPTSDRSRSHESRRRTRSHSPKLLLRNQLKEAGVPRGGSSLLKRLVGSGSMGVKTPKEIEEPKKVEIISLIDEDSLESSEFIGVLNENKSENQTIDNVSVKASNKQIGDLTKLDVCEVVDESLKQTIPNDGNCETVQISSITRQETKTDFTVTAGGSFTSSRYELQKSPVELVSGDVQVDSNIESKEEGQSGNSEVLPSEPLLLEDSRDSVIESENELNIYEEEKEKRVNDLSSHKDAEHKDEQEFTEDIDELNLRLEALRTAMLKKHKERKKRGFICRKKSTVEDDSFAEYVLDHAEKDDSLASQANAITASTDCNVDNMLGDILNPEDMVIDKSDKDDVDSNILDHFSHSLNYHSLHHPGSLPLLSESTYSALNGSSQYPTMEDGNIISNTNKNSSQSFACYVLPKNDILVPLLPQDATQIPLPEDKECFTSLNFSRVTTKPNDSNSLQHCLKEINCNKETITEKDKRTKRVSEKNKVCRRRESDGKKWRSSRAVLKRKLVRREYLHQKRRRKKCLRDLKIIRTEEFRNEEINDEINEESDEESALRELALKSVKGREKPKEVPDSEAFADGNILNSQNIISTNFGSSEIFNNLQIDIDNNVNIKPLVSCDSESTPTNLSSSETWDDIDEDILRAQLLSSLSSKMPIKSVENVKSFVPRFTKKQVKAALRRAELGLSIELRTDRRLKQGTQRVNKENFKKMFKTKVAEADKRKLGVLRIVNNNNKRKMAKTNQTVRQNSKEGPIVPKFIISLKEDSSSEDDLQSSPNKDKTDIVKSIDLFLQEARIENELKQGQINQRAPSLKSSDSKPEEAEHPIKKIKLNSKNDKVKEAGGSTPQVLKHLPAWQQEEYRRLKKQIAEKEKILKAAKCKMFPLELEGLNGSAFPKNLDKNELNKEENEEMFTKNQTEIVNSLGEAGGDCRNSLGISNVCEVNDSNREVLIAKEVESKNIEQQPPTKVNSPKDPIDSTKVVEEVNHMAIIVAHLEKEMGSFRNLHKDIVQKRKELLIAKLNMTKKKKMLFEIKRRLISKEKLIQSKIYQNSLSPEVPKLEQGDVKKQTRRDLELCKLRMREFSLKTKMIFDEIENSGVNKVTKLGLPGDKSKKIDLNMTTNACSNKLPNNNSAVPTIPTYTEKSKTNGSVSDQCCHSKGSLSFSEKQSENWDPFVPICPFDLSGVCKDEECKFQHIKAA